MNPTLFQQVLGAPFFNLPDAVRALHSVRGQGRYTGRADIERGTGALSRFCAWTVKLPPASNGEVLQFACEADEKSETWTRDFGGHAFASTLTERDGLLVERLGPMQFRFELHTHADTLYWNVAKAKLFGVLPLPAALFRGVQCREREVDGRYEFRVSARMPLAGLLIRYEGWLEPADPATRDLNARLAK